MHKETEEKGNECIQVMERRNGESEVLKMKIGGKRA